MRRTLVIAALAASITWASSVSAGTWFRKKVNPGVKAYVGSARDGFQIGTLFGEGWQVGGNPGEHFTYNTDNANGNWRWGRAHGWAGKCGWVDITQFSSVDSQTYACSSSLYSVATGLGARQYLLQWYAYCVNDYVPAGESVPMYRPVEVGTYMTTQVHTDYYGNWSPGSGVAPLRLGYIPGGSQFNWRWVTDDRLAVLGKVPSPGYWGFIPRGALIPQLCYEDGIWRLDVDGGS